MSPIARQELHDFAAAVRKRKAKEREPKPAWTFADYADGAVALACAIGVVVLIVR